MTEYSLILAFEDFLPVIFSSIGLFIISRMVSQSDGRLGQMAGVGWLFVTVGGLLKAIWKLVMALTAEQTNLVWLDKGMFLWMAVGFTLLAVSAWFFAEAQRGVKLPQRPWLFPLGLLGLTLGAILATGFPDVAVNTWRFILLGIMTIGNVVLVILLIQQARRHQLNGAAVLLLANILIVFILSGMARIPEQTIPLQWAEQLLNTGAQGAFAYAVWRLQRVLSVSETAVGQFA